MIDEIIQKIESVEFSALLGIASSFRLFCKILYDREEMKTLLKLSRKSPENRWLVFKRITELARQDIDLQYENPNDTAISAYLIALSLVDLELAKTAASSVLVAQNCWWSAKFANYLDRSKTPKEPVQSSEFPLPQNKVSRNSSLKNLSSKSSFTSGAFQKKYEQHTFLYLENIKSDFSSVA
jgi:hypothetical protein